MIPVAALPLILKMLGLAVSGLQMVPELRARYDAYSSTVTAMIDEGRNPTHEEWEALLSESADTTNRIAIALQRRKNTENYL